MYRNSRDIKRKFNVIDYVKSDEIVSDNSMNEKIYSDEEYVENANASIEGLDGIIEELCFDPAVFSIIEQFRVDNYKSLKYKEKVKLLADLNGIFSTCFEGFIDNGIYVTDVPVDNKNIDILDKKLYICVDFLKEKKLGLSILSSYIYTVKYYMIFTLENYFFQQGVDVAKLRGPAKIYYQNLAQSVLVNGWHNYLERDEKNYTKQPIIFDCLKLSKDITFEIMRRLYAKYHVIDEEMSDLLYEHMKFYQNFDKNSKIRKEIININKNNIKNIKQEIISYNLYLTLTLGNLEALSDDEFYAIFNESYYNALNDPIDGKLDIRLANILNELMERQFRDFNLEGIELPKYSFEYNEEDAMMKFTRTYNNISESCNIETASDSFKMFLYDISLIAQYHKLFKFNNEKEEKDFNDMWEWCELKHRDYSNPKDKELVNDGLNIILQKVNEMYDNLHKKILSSIAKSDFFPHGSSMIKHDPKDAYYDYHEFKNGYTKEEISDSIMKKIHDDISEMKKGGR